MNKPCPVCSTNLLGSRDMGNGAIQFNCRLCGPFFLTESLIDVLPSNLKLNTENSTKISHNIRKMQIKNKRPELNTDTIKNIIQQSLPKPKEQADLLLLWISQHQKIPGETVTLDSREHRTIIGAQTHKGFELIIKHLIKNGSLDGNLLKEGGDFRRFQVTLSMDGWNYIDQLDRGQIYESKAFMAMQFDDDLLNSVLENTFKPAALQAGFELRILSDRPEAGLIDNRLRNEIRTSAFIVADLTHDNAGAYWEAGYAEGLGKPVIYTCEAEKFNAKKTHFDTNHHLTIPWDVNNLNKAGEDLKGTIRATLPHLAKLQDD